MVDIGLCNRYFVSNYFINLFDIKTRSLNSLKRIFLKDKCKLGDTILSVHNFETILKPDYLQSCIQLSTSMIDYR